MIALQTCIETACLLEVTAPKPGNVHPSAAFADLTYADFVKSTSIVAPILSTAEHQGVAACILQAAQACQAQLGRNAQMGIILLLAPLAAVPERTSLAQGIAAVLDSLTITDSERVYEALSLVKPGGMGRVDQQDIRERPTLPLGEIMQLAANRDTIAGEYSSGFSIVLTSGVPLLKSFRELGQCWNEAIVRLHLTLMSQHPDTLIARKLGSRVAQQAATRAQAVLDSGWPHHPDSLAAIDAFDAWLREDGHNRNPGTTADLVCASLFAGLRDGHFGVPHNDMLDNTSHFS